MNCVKSFKAFRLLNALSDLMMLPTEMFADSSIRKEVSPWWLWFAFPVLCSVSRKQGYVFTVGNPTVCRSALCFVYHWPRGSSATMFRMSSLRTQFQLLYLRPWMLRLVHPGSVCLCISTHMLIKNVHLWSTDTSARESYLYPYRTPIFLE